MKWNTIIDRFQNPAFIQLPKRNVKYNVQEQAQHKWVTKPYITIKANEMNETHLRVLYSETTQVSPHRWGHSEFIHGGQQARIDPQSRDLALIAIVIAQVQNY